MLFSLEALHLSSPFSFLVDPRKCLFSLGCLTRIWFLSLTFPRTVYSRVSWCFLLRRYTFQAFFSSLFGLRKLSPFDVYLTRNRYFPRFSEKCLLSCFVVVFLLGRYSFQVVFPLCLISESCFPFVYYLTRVGCLRIFFCDMVLPKGFLPSFGE